MKKILNYLGIGSTKNSAQVAKERLQIIVSHERGQRNGPDYLPDLQRELIEVIAKYVPSAKDLIKIDRDGNRVNLTLDITLPEGKRLLQEVE